MKPPVCVKNGSETDIFEIFYKLQMTVQQVVGTKFQILFVSQDPNCGEFVEKKSAPHDFDTLKITRLHQ